jgi:hypothetical protein
LPTGRPLISAARTGIIDRVGVPGVDDMTLVAIRIRRWAAEFFAQRIPILPILFKLKRGIWGCPDHKTTNL